MPLIQNIKNIFSHQEVVGVNFTHPSDHDFVAALSIFAMYKTEKEIRNFCL